ncbi:hypothetical protein MXL46_09125 [Heyndrickxia sporothermodurans]|uniref:hypothetical protein n=1 Tax=Heyndrickxia sporothermodurans TaxID=46224 RepID=UPI002DBCCE38|nr:hypothetical protein [Heyndrickxia sporothermodurans]MEB6549254.1 hypothetical protein [Heyndrickxia sporothermodurans]
MAEHKGAITLLIAVLMLFAVWVFFGENYISPILTDIGDGFKSMVTNVFTDIPKNPTQP